MIKLYLCLTKFHTKKRIP